MYIADLRIYFWGGYRLIVCPIGGATQIILENAEHIDNIVCLEDKKDSLGEKYGYPVKSKEIIFEEANDCKIVILSSLQYHEIKRAYLEYVSEDRILPYMNFDTRIHFNYNADRYKQWLQIHREDISLVYSSLADEASKKHFEFLLRGAENCSAADLLDFGVYSDTEDPEYFSYKFDFLDLTEAENYLDVGAYDGDTVKAFVQAVKGRFGSITAVEPDAELFERLRTECRHIKGKVECLRIGLADSAGKAYLRASENKYMNELKKRDDGNVRLEAIDSLGKTFSFIKISVYNPDIRIGIIKGARNLLHTIKPKLVIQITRHTDDILDIPKEILKYNPDYKIYLRSMIWQQGESFRLNCALWAV